MIGSVTIVFAILERVQQKSKFMEKWDPRKLPAVRDPNRIPLSNSVMELTVNMVLCGWWPVVGRWPLVPDVKCTSASVTVTLAPIWRYFFWGYLVMDVGNIDLSSGQCFPALLDVATRRVRVLSSKRRSSDLLGDEGSTSLTGISVVNVAPEKTAAIAHIINWWAAKLFPWMIVFCVLLAVVNAYRIIRVRSSAVRAVR